MKRLAPTVPLIVAAALVCLAAPAYAGVFSSVKSWLTTEVGAMIASSAAALISGTLGVLYVKIIRTFRETGEFLATLGMALDDNSITSDELSDIIKEGREIFSVWM